MVFTAAVIVFIATAMAVTIKIVTMVGVLMDEDYYDCDDGHAMTAMTGEKYNVMEENKHCN